MLPFFEINKLFVIIMKNSVKLLAQTVYNN